MFSRFSFLFLLKSRNCVNLNGSVLIMEFLFFLIVGVCVGTFGTLIGLGGGLILVPLFMYTMYSPDGSKIFSTVQQIIGTSLFAVACNAVSGAYAYMKQRRIMFRAAIPFALSTIPGAFCGSFVSKYFTGPSFSIAFGCLLAVLGCFMYWKSNSKRATARPEDFDPATADFNLWLGVVLTFGVGFISTIFLTSAMRLPSVPRTVHRTAGRWLFARV